MGISVSNSLSKRPLLAATGSDRQGETVSSEDFGKSSAAGKSGFGRGSALSQEGISVPCSQELAGCVVPQKVVKSNMDMEVMKCFVAYPVMTVIAVAAFFMIGGFFAWILAAFIFALLAGMAVNFFEKDKRSLVVLRQKFRRFRREITPKSLILFSIIVSLAVLIIVSAFFYELFFFFPAVLLCVFVKKKLESCWRACKMRHSQN